MREGSVQVQFLNTSIKRAVGAMFRPPLGQKALAFVYPHPAPRLFHTLFCPPLRMLALADDGAVLFDRTVRNGRFIRLPASRVILEIDPEIPLTSLNLKRLTEQALREPVDSGSWQAEASIDRLFMALIKEAVADIRRVRQAHPVNGRVRLEVLREKFAVWERGRFAHSAGLLLDAVEHCNLPPASVRLSREVLQAEADGLDEIGAAAAGGEPWKAHFPHECLRCGATASWRPILVSWLELPAEACWRYERPENHAPLCKRCAAWLGWSGSPGLRVDAGLSLWARRFEALTAWHQSARDGSLPSGWDRHTYPLWPKTFGGRTWATGSGAFRHADPQPPLGIRRSRRHRQALARLVTGQGGLRRKAKSGRTPPWQPLLSLAGLTAEKILLKGRKPRHVP